MRIKPLALASACALSLSAPAALAGLDLTETGPEPSVAPTLSVELSTMAVMATHGAHSLDLIKSKVSHSGVTFVAQTENVTKTDVMPKAAVAQIGTPQDSFSYSIVAVLLALIGGGFMWLSLMRQRPDS